MSNPTSIITRKLINKLIMNNQFSLAIIMVVFSFLSIKAQDPLINHDWNASSNYSGGTVITDINPFGQNANMLETPGEPGWRGFRFQLLIDHSKTYRISFWAKFSDVYANPFLAEVLTKDPGGNNLDDIVRDGSTITHFKYVATGWNGQAIVPQTDMWYLFVAFVNGSSDTNTYNGGIFDVSGNLITQEPMSDARWQTTAQYLEFNSYYNYSTPTSNTAHFFDPRVEEVFNGDDNVTDLINPVSGNVPVTGVNLSPSNLTLDVGNSHQFTAIIAPSNATDQGVVWSSSNNSVASVNSSGLITAIAEGTTNITVTSIDGGFTAQSPITVNDSSGVGNPPPSGDSLWAKSGSTVSVTDKNDNVAIGTTAVPTGFKMAVDGKIIAEEIRVELSDSNGTWPDYVFSSDYHLPTLEEIQKHIKEKGHLPNIPSAQEAGENGIEVGEMNRLLLEKIEEQMLYILQLETSRNRHNELLHLQNQRILKMEEKLLHLQRKIRGK
jgi:hypothetical protein